MKRSMASIGIIYGSSTGKTEAAADLIQEVLGTGDVISIGQVTSEKLNSYDLLILGTSTWGTGDIQDDWAEQKGLLGEVNWKGKTVAFYGLGDQESFSETFLNGLGILYQWVAPLGARLVGAWPTDGYFFEASQALVNGKFVGLALDDDNQGALTDERVKKWVAGLRAEGFN